MTDVLHAVIQEGTIDVHASADNRDLFGRLAVGELDSLGLEDDGFRCGGFGAHLDGASVLESDISKSGDLGDEDEDEEGESVTAAVSEGSDHAGDGSDEAENGKVVETAGAIGAAEATAVVVAITMMMIALVLFLVLVIAMEETTRRVARRRSFLLRLLQTNSRLFLLVLISMRIGSQVKSRFRLLLRLLFFFVNTLFLRPRTHHVVTFCLLFLLVFALPLFVVISSVGVDRDDQNKEGIDEEESCTKKSALGPLVNAKLSFRKNGHCKMGCVVLFGGKCVIFFV